MRKTREIPITCPASGKPCYDANCSIKKCQVDEEEMIDNFLNNLTPEEITEILEEYERLGKERRRLTGH